jgi:general secretion pathway protein L
MARILGLDLGSHSVKAALIETTLRGYTLKSLTVVPTPAEGERNARLAAAVESLGTQVLLGVDTVVVSMPGVAIATHAVSLPFSDPKKIDSTLGFEVEGQLPFDLESAIFDYQVAYADDSGAQLSVGVVKKDELRWLLEILKGARIDPRIVTHPALVYPSLLAAMPGGGPGDEAVAVVDLGHERTNVATGSPGGAVEFARTFSGGGEDLTRALSREFQIPLADAASWKETHGAVGDEVVGPDAERAAGAFNRALQPVLRELRPTFKAYSSRARRPIGQVLLCGGTARLRGLSTQLTRHLCIPTQLLELPPQTTEIASAERLDAAQAIALALRGHASGARAPRFNLRRGEFAFKSDFDFMTDRLGRLAAYASTLFVLMVAGGVVRNAVLEGREKQVDAQFCEATQRVFGKCEKDPTIALALLKGQESAAAGVPRRSATTLLAELSQRVPTTLKVKMDQVAIDLDRISMRCEGTESKDMEDLITALKQYRCFKEIKEGKLEKSKDGSKVTFRLEVQVECPEDNPAPQG